MHTGGANLPHGEHRKVETRRVHICVPRHQYDGLKQRSRCEGRSVSDIVRHLVYKYLISTGAVKDATKEEYD